MPSHALVESIMRNEERRAAAVERDPSQLAWNWFAIRRGAAMAGYASQDEFCGVR
jgi:hypothetical protein